MPIIEVKKLSKTFKVKLKEKGIKGSRNCSQRYWCNEGL